MRPHITRLALLPALIAPAFVAVPAYAASPQSSTQAAIKIENARWADAFKRGDYQAIGGLYTEDGTLMQPGGERVRGKAAIQEYFTKNYSGMPLATVTFSNFEFYGNDETVTEVSDAVIQSADGRLLYSGKQTLIFVKQGGTWKLRSDMWNDNGPSNGGGN